MIIANSSPLIVLGRLGRFDIIEHLFGQIYIPNTVYQETVVETVIENQRRAILAAIEANIIVTFKPSIDHPFTRSLDQGEKGVLNLALENGASGIIIDDKKTRREAAELGFDKILLYTSDLLRGAERRGLVPSYAEVMGQLRTMGIYLPD